MGEKRVIEEQHVNVVYNDDYALKDSATNDTTAILWSDIKAWINSGMATESDLDNAIANFASEYSTSTSYAVGDFCVFDGVLYECVGATTGDWDSTKWTAITIGDKLISLDADVATLLRDIISNGYAWSSTTHYAKNSIVIYNKAIYKCAVDNPTVGTFVDNEWFKTDAKSLIDNVEDMICSRYQPSSVGFTHKYYVGDLVWIYENYKKVIYIANTENQDSSWTEDHWDKVKDISGLSKYLVDMIGEAGQVDDVQVKTTGDYESVVDENKVAKIDLSNVLIEKSVPNLPQSVAIFNDGSDLPLKSLTASIVPVQSGSGDPSPENVRPISGWTEEVITVTDDLQNPTVTHTTTIPFVDGQGESVTVYGGEIDVINGGEQPNKLKKLTFTGASNESWTRSGTGGSNKSYFYTVIGGSNYAIDVVNAISNIAVRTSITSDNTNIGFAVAYSSAREQTELRIRPSNITSITTVSQFKTWLQTNNFEVLFELAAPTTFYTQPTSIKSLEGVNNVFASTGDVTKLEYIANATDVIANLEARVTELENA